MLSREIEIDVDVLHTRIRKQLNGQRFFRQNHLYRICCRALEPNFVKHSIGIGSIGIVLRKRIQTSTFDAPNYMPNKDRIAAKCS